MPSISILTSLRDKPYSVASQEEKQAWFIYCSVIIPAVVPHWKRKCGQNDQLLSTIITPTDEAFALWTIKVRLQSWITKAQEKVVAPQKLGKVRGQHYSTTDMRAFYDIHQAVKDIRQNQYSNVWEIAFQKQCLTVDALSNEHPHHGGDESDEKYGKIDIPMDYSDDE